MQIAPARCLSIVILTGFLGVSNAEEAGSPEPFLEAVIEHTRRGDLHGAWGAYISFFSHPRANELIPESFARCFMHAGCIGVGRLGEVLGKSKADAAAMRSFCPQWTELIAYVHAGYDDPERAEAQVRVVEDAIANMKRYTFGASCEAWADEQLQRLDDRPSAARHRSIVLPMGHYWEGGAQMRPAVKARIGKYEMTLFVDIGSTSGKLNAVRSKQLALEPFDSVPVLEEVGVDRFWAHHSVARIDLWLESSPHRTAIRLSENSQDGEAPLDDGMLGMNMMLRYPAVCFSWADARLHLGDLGPCAAGARHEGALSNMFELSVGAVAADGSAYVAVLDTGSSTTSCTSRFLQASGDGRFSFGGRDGLPGNCTETYEVEHVLRAPGENRDITVGMDNLSKLSAFGWRLDPVEVFMLPRPNSRRATGASQVPR